MKKILSISIFAFILFNIFGTSVAFAQEAGTLLPETTLSATECDSKLYYLELVPTETITKPDGTQGKAIDAKEFFSAPEQDRSYRNDILACAVITGKIKFWMIPFYIVYLIEFAIGISGLVAIAFLVIGGFQYVIGGATEKQESAKNTITYALGGLVVVLIAWVIVNLVQFLITI